MSEKIFISYRRKDALEKARLMRFFMQECKVSVFLDTEIDRSKDFTDELTRKITNCEDYVLLVSEDACHYRYDHPDGDWLFREIKIAVDSYRQKLAMNENDPHMKLHLTAVSKDVLNKFIHMEVPEEYREAHSVICGCTKEPRLLDFEELSDKQVRSLYATTLQSFEASRREPLERGAPIYVQGEEEHQRLVRQGKLSYEQDKGFMEEIVAEVHQRMGNYEPLTVLDVGCSSGETGQCYFSDSSQYRMLVGIDWNDNVVRKARANGRRVNAAFAYETVDISADDFDAQLGQLRADLLENEKFDIVFCCQVLHHIPVAHRRRVIQTLAKHMKTGGCLIIRGSDDGTKLLYDNEDGNRLINSIVDLTIQMPTIADRFYGRKISAELLSNGFVGVVVKPITLATSRCPNMAQYEWVNFYRSSFDWRRKIFDPNENDSPRRIAELLGQRKEMESLLEELETKMLQQHDWYMETDFFGYGFLS